MFLQPLELVLRGGHSGLPGPGEGAGLGWPGGGPSPGPRTAPSAPRGAVCVGAVGVEDLGSGVSGEAMHPLSPSAPSDNRESGATMIPGEGAHRCLPTCGGRDCHRYRPLLHACSEFPHGSPRGVSASSLGGGRQGQVGDRVWARPHGAGGTVWPLGPHRELGRGQP